MLLRRMTDNDIEAGLRLCRAARWNQQHLDWNLFLQCNPEGCYVIEQEGRVAGTVTTLRFGTNVGWIAMLLVDPANRRQGIGTRLMHVAMEALSNCDCIKLDATPEGKKVYDQLGFVDEVSFSRMTASSVPTADGAKSGEVRNMRVEDLDFVAALDRQTFAAPRLPLLQEIHGMAPQYALIAEDEGGKGVGFTLGRHGHAYEHIGPIVAPDLETAKNLARVAFTRADERPLLCDVSLHNPAWMAWLASLGFVEQRRFVRMRRGPSAASACMEFGFAIAGPELG